VQRNSGDFYAMRARHPVMTGVLVMTGLTRSSEKSYSDPNYFSRSIRAVLSQRPWPAAAMRP
jgi:hypothetical protein